MNDSASEQRRREQRGIPEFDIGEYITNTPNNDDHQQQQDMDFFTEFHQGPGASHMSLHESTQNMMEQNALGSRSDIEYLPQSHPQTAIPADMLKGRLEQQMKLQQLQQLQNEILHQQLELIGNDTLMTDQQKEAIFHGLLTPGPSSELRAISTKDLVSPMMLQPEMYGPSATAIVNQLSPHHNPPMSAPAALAFHTTPPFPLPGPAEPEYDLSPLTSPWLLPVSHTHQRERFQSEQHHEPRQQAPQRPTRLKRTVSSSGDEQGGARKRTAHLAIESKRNGPPTSPSSSSASTPGARGMGGLAMGLVPLLAPSNDTPSPVDLSMPPPAPPSIINVHPQSTMSSSASSSTSLSTPGSTSVSPNIAPVTPASIMNLGRLPTGLAPSHPSAHMDGRDTGSGVKKSGKGKGVARSGTTGASGVTTRARRGSIARPGISPNLKPILPGATAIAPAPASPLTHSPQVTFGTSSNFALNSNSTGNMPPRKTSHKAAEQKRRDSLKTSFDDLRLLLPPVPLPEDVGDEPPLPGSMPPRGPPKGDADGPNRGVSKLALLRCGNAYIRDLKDKVTRRDEEIDNLRDEIRRLRVLVQEDDTSCGALDLERDVDEGVVASGYIPGTVGGECGMDGDEEGE